MTAYVIGVDPGLSCGVAALVDARLVWVWQGQRPDFSNVLRGAIDVACQRLGRSPVLACERYVKRPERGGNTRSAQTDAEELIGVVFDVANATTCRLVLQSPASAKAFASNMLLRSLGLYVSAAERGWPDANDANDAVRHALLATASCYASVFDARLTEIGS